MLGGYGRIFGYREYSKSHTMRGLEYLKQMLVRSGSKVWNRS